MSSSRIGSGRKMRASMVFGSRTIGPEAHVREDVALDVDPRRDLGELQALRRQPEDAALGDVEHRLSRPRPRMRAVERDLLDRLDELRVLPLGDDPELAVLDPHLEPAGGERAGEHELARVLADVDEAAGAGELRPEPAHVHVAGAVGLRHAEARQVEPAAVVEVELLVLVR